MPHICYLMYNLIWNALQSSEHVLSKHVWQMPGLRPRLENVSKLLYDRVVTRRTNTTLEADFVGERVNKQVVYKTGRSE